MKDLTWAVRQLFSSAPLETTLLMSLVIIQGIIPGIFLLAIQGIIQWIGAESSFPILWVILLGTLFLADVVLNPIVSVLRLQLNEKILTHCNILLMEKANTLQGLDCFERGEIYDSIHFLRNEAARRPLNLVYILTGPAMKGAGPFQNRNIAGPAPFIPYFYHFPGKKSLYDSNQREYADVFTETGIKQLQNELLERSKEKMEFNCEIIKTHLVPLG